MLLFCTVTVSFEALMSQMCLTSFIYNPILPSTLFNDAKALTLSDIVILFEIHLNLQENIMNLMHMLR